MKALTRLTRYGLVVCALGGCALRAEQPGLDLAFKLHTLLSKTSTDQNMSNEVLGHGLELGGGFGVELGYRAGRTRYSAELGYAFQTGNEVLADTSGMPVQGGQVINQATSMESRKNKVEGMMLRLGVEQPWNQTWSWRAGLQFGGNTFTHQVIGNINGVGKTGFADSYFYVGSKSSLTPSPFAGVTLAINEDSALEMGVLLQQYTSLNYQHVANTSNQFDTVAQNKRVVPTLEITYAFRF